MPIESNDLVKVSVRMSKILLKKISRLHPHESISELIRHLIEREIRRGRVFKSHMKLYGRFQPGDFDESIL